MPRPQLTALHPRLFIRGHTKGTAGLLPVLVDHDVRLVVNVALIRDITLAAEAPLWRIQYLHVPLSDSREVHVDAVVPLIFRVAQAMHSHGVLVHCDSGRNRSSLIAIPALSMVTGQPTRHVLAAARKLRPIARGLLDNVAFQRFVFSRDWRLYSSVVGAPYAADTR